MDILDSNFRVRGATSLRVVVPRSYTNIPGIFIVTRDLLYDPGIVNEVIP
jgi:hypothetical protein